MTIEGEKILSDIYQEVFQIYFKHIKQESFEFKVIWL